MLPFERQGLVRMPVPARVARGDGLRAERDGLALVATYYDGNLVFVDSITEKDLLPDGIAALVVAKRKAGWGFGQRVHADPSVWHRTGQRNKWGRPAMLADEFTEAGGAAPAREQRSARRPDPAADADRA
jgi:hypothetical protein